MSYKQVETKDKDGNILVTPYANVSNDPNYKIVEILDKDGNKLATPVAVVIGGGGGGGDISGLVRNLTSLGANVSLTETLNADNTKNYELTVDGITQSQLSTALQDYYTKSETDAKLSQKAFVVDTYSQIIGGSGVGVASAVAADGSKTATISVNSGGGSQRVKTLDDLGITEAIVNNLPTKPSSTNDSTRRNAFKEFIFLIADALGDNEIFVDQLLNATRPKAYSYVNQIISLNNFSTPTTDPIEVKVTKKSFELNGRSGGTPKMVRGYIDKSGNYMKIFSFENMSVSDIIWDDAANLSAAQRFRSYITAISWYNSGRSVSLDVGAFISQNIYKDCLKLFNLPSNYTQSFKIEFHLPHQYGTSVDKPTTFKLIATEENNAYHTLEFKYTQGSTLTAINSAKYGYVRYSKALAQQTVANNETYRLTDLMAPSNRDQLLILGTKDAGGVFTTAGSTLANGLFFVNHNRRARIDIQLRLDISVGSLQALNVLIRRGDGTLVDTNIGTLIRTPDTSKTTANITTFSAGLTDLFVTSGFELVLVNTSGTSVTLPAQTVVVDYHVTYY